MVGVGEMKIARNPGEVLITYALGSCLGLVIHDPVVGVGGLLHAMLPLSTIDPDKARINPARYVDTGVPKLFADCYRAGAVKERLVVSVAGGAALQNREGDSFQIGQRNLLMLRKLLWKNGVLIKAEDVGGSSWRTLSLHIGSGEVRIKTEAGETRL